MAASVLVSAEGISRRYDEMLVLDAIDLSIRDGEFVALLGPSGSGKSTLLRIVTGLMQPSSGLVRYRGVPVDGPCPHAAMVFQTFALYPWLTVLENVALGLKARGMPLRERRSRANRLIELIGLEGFEDAYPKELSGGMRQRVGFARALAVEPELLCMDEPFSALDFLTAENLRNELLDLWTERRIPTRSVLMVTHGVEEAVAMADRIVVLSRNPARVVADVAIGLPRPRNRKHAAFLALVDRIYKIVTEGADPATSPTGAPDHPAQARFAPLPQAAIGMLNGLLELVADRGGRDDLYHLGSELMLEVDDLLPVTEAAELVGLAVVREGDLCLTDLGRRYTDEGATGRKQIVAAQIRDLPLFAVIRRVLASKRDHTMRREFFVEISARELGEAQAEALVDAAVSWGRWAELFAYDHAAEEFYLPEDEADEEDGALEDPPAGEGLADTDGPPGGGEPRP